MRRYAFLCRRLCREDIMDYVHDPNVEGLAGATFERFEVAIASGAFKSRRKLVIVYPSNIAMLPGLAEPCAELMN